MSAFTLQEELTSLFNRGCYQDIVLKSLSCNVTPTSDPFSSNILAAAYFRLGDYSTAQVLLSDLEVSFGEQCSFLSLYAATCRRLGMFEKAEELFQKALSIDDTSIHTMNNYANLLIDKSNYDQARSFLDRVLQINPTYKDALENLHRLNTLVSSRTLGDQSDNQDTLINSSFKDPLLLAFGKEEVDFSLNRYLSAASKDKTKKLIDSFIDPTDESTALEQLDVAEKAITEGSFELVLKICSQVLKVLGPNARIYEYASYAYLNLKIYHQSEICLLHSLVLGGGTVKRYFNLVSFACMRKDFVLADYYLTKISQIDPTSPHLDKLVKNVHSQKVKFDNSYNFNTDWGTSLSVK